MANAWIEHVKNWSKANNVSYGCAISKPECKEAYQKKKNRSNLESLKKPQSVRLAKTKKAKTQEQPEVTGKISKDKIDKMAKDIEALREKAGRIAEREGKVTTQVSKLLEKKDQLMKERLLLLKEYKQKKS